MKEIQQDDLDWLLKLSNNSRDLSDIDMERMNTIFQESHASNLVIPRLEDNLIYSIYRSFFEKVIFQKTELSYKGINECNFEFNLFDQGSFVKTDIQNSSFKYCIFIRCNLVRTFFYKCTFSNCMFINCKLQRTSFSNSEIDSCTFLNEVEPTIRKSKIMKSFINHEFIHEKEFSE